MSDEISACPFCQSVRTRVISVRDGVRVHCGDCLAEGPPIFLGPEGYETARGAAIAAWGPISPCPHISTSREGTSYCRLAESDARDVARYRWLRDLPEGSTYEEIGNFPGQMWDEAIDKAMALNQPEKSP